MITLIVILAIIMISPERNKSEMKIEYDKPPIFTMFMIVFAIGLDLTLSALGAITLVNYIAK